MKSNPEKSNRNTFENCKKLLENCPDKQGKMDFLHEGKEIFYQFIDFPEISPVVQMGDLIFYVDSDGAQEGDLLLLKHIKTGRQKIGYVIPVKLDERGNEIRGAEIKDDKGDILPLEDVLIIKYAAGIEEYLHIDDFDIHKIVNFIHKK
jgi:hypothetical protein